MKMDGNDVRFLAEQLATVSRAGMERLCEEAVEYAYAHYAVAVAWRRSQRTRWAAFVAWLRACP